MGGRSPMRCAAICFLLDFGWGRRKLPAMTTFLVILLIAAMIATVVALVRGIISFLQEASAEARGEGPTASQLKSNRMMQQRIFFQALAITVVVLLLFMAGRT